MKIRIGILLCLLWLFSCQKDYFVPLIITGQVTNVDQSGAVFHANITSIGDKPILEYGFVWDTISNPTIETAEKFIISQPAEIGTLSAKIKSGLIPDETYFVRAFIRNSDITTYGEETSFLSHGSAMPFITGIIPLEGSLGDTLIIFGKNFSNRSSEVKFDQITATIVRSSQDTLFVIVPSTLKNKKSAVTLSNLNQVIAAKDSFSLISPKIYGFEANKGTYGDEVIIRCRLLSKHHASLKVFFDSVEAQFSYIDDQTLKAIVPDQLDIAQSHISVSMNNQTAVSLEKFTLLPLELIDFSPKNALTGKPITITGKHFNPVAAKNKVYIDGKLARAISVDGNSLTVTVPTQDSVVYHSRNVNISVQTVGVTRVLDEILTINDQWFRKANVPYELRHETLLCSTCHPIITYDYAKSFVVGNTAYIGLNASKNFWAYDTENDSWRKLADFPGVPRFNATGFVIGDKIYLGTGGNDINNTQLFVDWWEYDTKADRWTQKADIPFVPNSNLVTFSTSSGSYLTRGFNWVMEKNDYELNLWRYNPDEDTWSLEEVDIRKLKKFNPWRIAKTVNDEVLVGYLEYHTSSQISFYLFNPETKAFKSISNFPYRGAFCTINSMVLNNRIYVQASDYYSDSSTKTFFFYDPISNSWKFNETKINAGISYGISFEVGNIGFAGMGSSNQLFEFDPNR